MVHSHHARLVVAFLLLVAAPGCTATGLRRTTINQLETVHDLYEQQVLDNLAMFVHNRGSYPYFSVVSTGTTTLMDTASLADSNGWARSAKNSLLYATAGLNPTLTRSKTGSWATFPINDSVKLTVMRCVYHAAIDGCLSAPGESCPDCANLFYAYYNMEPPGEDKTIPYHGGPSNNPKDPTNMPLYTGKPTSTAAKDSYQIDIGIPFVSQDQFKGYTLRFSSNGETYLVEQSIANGKKTSLIVKDPLMQDHADDFELFLNKRDPIRGIVTPECLAFRQGWFCSGPKLPKHFDKCTPHGYYCGTYVWVPPAGIEQLTKLTLLVQDLAYYNPPQANSQTVTTQTAATTPGGTSTALKSKRLRESQKTYQDMLDDANVDPKTKSLIAPLRDMLKQMADEAEVSAQDASTTTTTTTTTSPTTRQPTTFQPSILNLQQDLNLFPRQ